MKPDSVAWVPTREEILAELARIVDSRWFRESHHLRALLTYIVTETLEGRESGLKEYNLGVNVLHRHVDYDPRTDSIVRVQFSQLRKKLAMLYQEDPGTAPFRIQIQKGSYVPVFAPQPPKEAAIPAQEVEIVSPAPRGRVWPAFLAGVGLTALVAALLFAISSRGQEARAPTPALWAPLVQSGAPAIVSFGVPLFYVGNGLYVRDVLVNQPGQELNSGIERVGKAMKQMLRPHDDVYTGIGESVGTYEVGRFLERRGVKVQISNSHYLGPSDLRGKNLVIISSSRFQTPLNQFHLPVAFRFLPEMVGGAYSNPNPLAGELAAYETKGGGAGGVSTSYATICVWPGTSADHRLILISGISSWCTMAASRYALDLKSQADLERRMAGDPAEGPRGRKSPYYQVLIRTEGKNDQVRSYEYVAHRYLDARPIRAE